MMRSLQRSSRKLVRCSCVRLPLPFASAVPTRASQTYTACPRPFASVEDLLRYGAIWRTLKRAYGASIAVDEMRASHVLVTDADGFVWKDVSVSAIIQSSNTLWYADHRGRSPTLDIERSPHVDTHARARSYCSMHPWVSKLLKIGAWETHGPRMAIGRDWQAWEELIAKEELLPAPDSDIADDPLLSSSSMRASLPSCGIISRPRGVPPLPTPSC